MKTDPSKIIIVLMMLVIAKNIFSQSSIDVGQNSEINVEAGSDVCGDIQSGGGEFTGSGTWCTGVLPVELLTFFAETGNNSVTLKWSTSIESNNSGFEIQRSTAQTSDWVKAGFKSGAGNSANQTDYVFTDNNLPGGKYFYRLKQIDFNGNFEYFELQQEIIVGNPLKFYLAQNYPNPFNPSTVISFDIPEDANVVMKVFDVSGREVKTLVNSSMPPGRYNFKFYSGELASGTYFCKLSAFSNMSSFSHIIRMTIVK